MAPTPILTKDNDRIENRVQRLRRVRGLTQEDLGALLGVSRQTINAIEKGRHVPGLKLAFDIANVFASRIEDVFRPVRDSPASPAWSTVMIVIPDRLAAGKVDLRPHRPSDLLAFQRFLNDDASVKYMAFTPDQRTAEGGAAMMDAVIGSYAGATPICSLTIADSKTGQYLGSVGAAEAGELSMEVFVTVMPEARGRGIAKMAMHALERHLFSTSGAKELRADVVAKNTAAVRLFEGLGYRNMGHIERAAEDGVLGHRDMAGLRYVLTDKAFAKASVQ